MEQYPFPGGYKGPLMRVQVGEPAVRNDGREVIIYSRLDRDEYEICLGKQPCLYSVEEVELLGEGSTMLGLMRLEEAFLKIDDIIPGDQKPLGSQLE